MARAALDVAIGGFEGLEQPGPGLSVARALREGFGTELRITAVGSDGLLTGAWMHGVADALCCLPDARVEPDGFAEALMRLLQAERIRAYLPGSAAEVLALIPRRPALERAGVACPLPSGETARHLDRRGQVRFLRDGGFAVPFSQFVADLADARLVSDQIGYPVVVLGMISGATLAYHAREAEFAARQLGSNQGVVVRRALAGQGFNIALIADGGGRVRGLVTMRHLLSDPLGLPVSGAVIEDEAVRDVALRLHKALGWRGPLEIDLVRPNGSDSLLVTDLRPTLPNWSMLTHWAGCNLPVIALSEALGRPRSARPKAGVLFVRGVDETAVRLAAFQQLRHGFRPSDGNGRERSGPPSVPHQAARLQHPARESYGPADHGRTLDTSAAGGNHRRGSDANATADEVGNGNDLNGLHAPTIRVSGGLRIAVTGIGSFDVVNPGLGAARALRHAPEVSAIYGFGYGTLESGVYQPDLFDACFRLPPSSVDELFEQIAGVYARHPFDVLIPCLDGELPNFIRIEPRLRRLGVATLMPTKRALEARCKISLFSGRIAGDWGAFRIPESRIARTEAEVVAAAEALGVPCAVKGPISRCFSCRSTDEARAAFRRLRWESADRVIVQEFLEGEIFATAAVCDREHRTVVSTTIKKAAICGRGSTWSAVHVPNPDLEESFAAFLRAIRWVGPAEGEFMRDRLTDGYCLFEVNPRFTAWINFTARLGTNHPLATALVALGRSPPSLRDDRSVMFMRSSVEVCVRPAGLASYSTRGALIHA